MADNTNLIPAPELAAKDKVHFPNESPEYRQARNDLLSAEIELRRHVERVAALRRALPSGGEIPEDYVFESSNGAVRLSQLFGDKDTLVIYSMMFGPQRERACPMCTAMLTSWEGTARNLRERVALAVTARSPIERLLDFKKRTWLAEPADLLRQERRLHPLLCQCRRWRRPWSCSLHSRRWQDSPLLERRDEW